MQVRDAFLSAETGNNSLFFPEERMPPAFQSKIFQEPALFRKSNI
jgi:hypothetical protein